MKKFLFNNVLQREHSISNRMICFLILLFVYPSIVFSESVWVSRLFNSSDGLAYQIVRDIAETPDGSIWFATWGGGLSRFNGSEWETINEEKDISDYMIRCLACDHQGGLWVGSVSGIKYFDGQKWEIYSTQNTPGLEMDSVFCITVRKNGEIWFGMDDGYLYSYNPKEKASDRWTLIRNPAVFKNKSIRCMIELEDGSIMLGGQNASLFDGWKWIDYSVGQEIRSLYQTKDKRILAAGLENLLQFDGEKWDNFEESVLTPLSIVEAKDGSIFVGALRGVYLFQHNVWKSFQLSKELSHPYVENISSLEDGSIWIGTRSGAYLVRQSDWSVCLPPKSKGSVKEEHVYSSSQISPKLITQEGEIICPSGDDWQIIGTLRNHNAEIVRFMNYENDSVLIQHINAIVEYDPSSLLPIRSIPILDSFENYEAYQTSDGVFWLHGSDGIYFWTGLEWKPYVRQNNKINKRVRTMRETRDGTIWIVYRDGIEAIGKDLSFLDVLKTTRNIGHPVTDICVARDGSIWFGTSGVGIFVYDGEQLINYNTHNGLPNDWILSLYETSDGTIWAGMDDSTAASFRDNRWITFSKNDIKLEGRIEKIMEDVDGAIWFVVEPGGLVRYTPSTNAPDTIIDVSPQEIVPQGMGLFSFHGWDAWHTTMPDDLVFSWRIFDNRNGRDVVPWTPYESVSTVSSPHLNPGGYRFEVRAADKERNVDPTPASVQFSVEPYFFMKPGFLIPVLFLMILVLISLIIVAWKHRALRESEKWLSQAQQIAHIGHWIADFSQNKLFGSDETYRILGTVRDDVKGLYKSYLRFIHPKDLKFVQQTIRSALKGKNSFTFDHRIIKVGGVSRMVQIQAKILKNDSGQLIRMMGTIQDITAKQRAEENAQRVQKLESIGVLAGGIAHDFNNLLTAVCGNISLVKRSLDPQSASYNQLLESEKATHKAHDLTMKLISFGEASKPVKKVSSLGKIVENSASHALEEYNTRCDFHTQDNLNEVEIDRNQIDRVIQNVVINASQSMPEGGLINIYIKNIEVDDESMMDLSQGDYLVVTIEDHGCGIPPEHLSKIFDPYFTTKDYVTQKGMGLGLAISFAIIKQHNGYIEVESEPGVGSKFNIYLPSC